MNQILQTNFKKANNKVTKIFLHLQLYFSVVLFIVTFIIITINKAILYRREKYSIKLLENYNITRLYSSITSTNHLNIDKDSFNNSSIFGKIEIPKININYVVFSSYNEELLKISPCKFYGPNLPGKTGNLCIAGHNYDNDKFFSKLYMLNKEDEINIYDNYNQKLIYKVIDIYEVKSDDLTPIYNYNRNSKLLTLITCNNKNNNRTIIKASLY